MNKKIIKFLHSRILLLFCCIFLFGCQHDAYDDHFWGERSTTETQVNSGDFSNSGTIFRLPDKNVQNILLQKINTAKNTIWIEIYSFTKMDDILTALKNAKNRGVDVKILLEGNVFGSPNINIPAKKFFESAKIPVRYADNNRFVFTHAKFFIIDDEYFVSTGNFTKGFFTKNREYIFSGKDNSTRDFLKMIFIKDFNYQPFNDVLAVLPHIVISPLDSRSKITAFLERAQSEIFVYVQTVSDKKILQVLQSLHESGKKVFLCTARNEGNLRAMEFWPYDWYLATNPYLHAKVMLRDNQELFIGSQNFTKNSLENNREMGIIIQNDIENNRKIKNDIIKHCKKEK